MLVRLSVTRFRSLIILHMLHDLLMLAGFSTLAQITLSVFAAMLQHVPLCDAGFLLAMWRFHWESAYMGNSCGRYKEDADKKINEAQRYRYHMPAALSCTSCKLPQALRFLDSVCEQSVHLCCPSWVSKIVYVDHKHVRHIDQHIMQLHYNIIRDLDKLNFSIACLSC